MEIDDDVLQCFRCGVKLKGKIFKEMSACPLCRAPKYSPKLIREINREYERRAKLTSNGS